MTIGLLESFAIAETDPAANITVIAPVVNRFLILFFIFCFSS
jgi:hypothetical protein